METKTSLSPPLRLRVPEAAARLGIAPRSLATRGWRIKHGIPCVKIGRSVVFDAASLEKWPTKHQERSLRDVEGGER